MTNYHKWISLDDVMMTAIDVKAYKSHRNWKSIKRSIGNIYRRLTLMNSGTSVLLCFSVSLLAVAHT